MTCLRNLPGSSKLACMAHARRYFAEALPTAAVACAQALALIKQLYGIERVASDLATSDAPARQGLRQEQARPLLERLQAYLAGAAGGGVTEESARCGYRLRIAQLGRLDPLHRRRSASKSTIMAREQARYDRSCWAAKTGCSRGAKRRHTEPQSCVPSCRLRKHLQINPFIYWRDVIERVSTHPARLVLELTPREM